MPQLPARLSGPRDPTRTHPTRVEIWLVELVRGVQPVSPLWWAYCHLRLS